MKKTLLKFLCLTLSAILLISCGNPAESSTTESTAVSTTETTTEPSQTTTSETTTAPTLPTPEYFVSPEDEAQATKTFTATNKDGIEVNLIVYGYASENLGMDFYVKSSEPILIVSKITNKSTSAIYQTTPHNDRNYFYFTSDIADSQGNSLRKDPLYFNIFADAHSTASLEPSETRTQPIHLFAGRSYQTSDTQEILDTSYHNEYYLYPESIYTDGICHFSGTIDLHYRYEKDSHPDTQSISCDIALDIVHTPVKEYYHILELPDEVEATKTFTATNEDGIELSITVHGYASESFGMDFYTKNDDYILFDIQVANRSDSTIYQFIPTVTDFPTLEGTIKADHTDGQLHIIDMFGLQEAIRIGELAPNETATRYNLRALAKTTEEDFDSSGRGYFSGTLWLPYGVEPLTPQNIYRVPTNNIFLSCDIKILVFNVPETN